MMISSIVRWFIGSRDYKITVDTDRAAKLLIASGANYSRLSVSNGELSFRLQYSDCKAVDQIFTAYGICAEVVSSRGIGYLLHRYKRRIGIPIGIFLFFAIIFASEQFIWTVDVVGNNTIPSSQIISRLESLGCGVGTYIPAVDFDTLHNSFLLEHDDVAWIAVNVRGTRATVEVLEMLSPDKAPDESAPHNLVASEDGVIEYMEILRGEPIARCDELVRKGEILASGVEQMKHGLRLVHARGSVRAQVKRTVSVSVPLAYTERVLSGREFCEKYLNFFGISVKFFANTGNLSAEYDKIIRDEPLRFFDTVEVPIILHEEIYREYTDVPVTLTEEEARSEAYRRLREECARLTADCELVSRKIEAGLRGGEYVIECELLVVTDIAEEIPIYTTEQTGVD